MNSNFQAVFILVQVRITLGVKLCSEGIKMNPQHEHVWNWWDRVVSHPQKLIAFKSKNNEIQWAFQLIQTDNGLFRMVNLSAAYIRNQMWNINIQRYLSEPNTLWPSSGYMNWVLLVKRIEYLCIVVVVKTTVGSP